MSRVILGVNLVLAVLCLPLSSFLSAQGEREQNSEGRAGEYGVAGGAAEAGGYGGEFGGRGGYGGEYGGEYGAEMGGRQELSTNDGHGDNPFNGKQPDIPKSGKSTSIKRIEAAISENLKAPIQYEGQPLVEIVHALAEEYDIPILFDTAALEEVGISPETQVSINLRNITLGSALKLMLRQPGLEDLTYMVDDEVLLITTEEKANEKLTVEVYRVDDLVKGYRQQPSSNENPYSSLVQVITRAVAYDTWMVNGSGEGEALLMQPGLLVVSQTNRVHAEVRDLLEKLRSVRATVSEPDTDGSYGGRGGRGGGRF